MKLSIIKRLTIVPFFIAAALTLLLAVIIALIVLILSGKKFNVEAVFDRLVLLEHKWYPGLEILFSKSLYQEYKRSITKNPTIQL